MVCGFPSCTHCMVENMEDVRQKVVNNMEDDFRAVVERNTKNDMNSVALEGRMEGKEYGNSFASFTLVSTAYDGRTQETTRLSVVAYGKLALALRAEPEGRRLRVCGRLATEPDGSRCHIVADYVETIGGGR